MPRHQERRHLPFRADQIYAMVADVGRYPEFLPWVVAVRIRSDNDHQMIADLIVGFRGLREQFTSRVHKRVHEEISVDYLDGPMRHLHNRWRFSDAPDGGCIVDFDVDFAFRSSLFERLAGQMFDKALRRLTAAFEERAHALYGASCNPSDAGSDNSSA